MLSQDYCEAISETLDILDHSDQEYVSRISKNFINFLKENASKTYKSSLDHSKKLIEMNLNEKTKIILTLIYRNYLCNSEQKIELDKILKEKEDAYQQELREKYNPDKIFEQNKNFQNSANTIINQDIENGNEIVEYKESIFIKIINKIKKILHLN